MASKDRLDYALSKLTGIGLSREQAYGVLGSLAGESGRSLNTKAVNPNDPGGSYGIPQWNGSRKKDYYSYADRRGKAREDFRTQVDFIVHELTDPKQSRRSSTRGVLDALKNSKDRYEAAKVWTNKYERPSIPNHKGRYKNADYFANLAAGKAKPTLSERGKSATGAVLDEVAFEGEVPTPTARPSDRPLQYAEEEMGVDRQNGPLGAINNALHSIAGTNRTNTGDKSFFGDVSTGAIIGSLAGGFFAGPMGAMAGGFIGQGIGRSLENVGRDARTGAVTTQTGRGSNGGQQTRGQFDIGGGIDRAIGGLLSSLGGSRGTIEPSVRDSNSAPRGPSWSGGRGGSRSGGSISQAAQDAIDSGQGGLF